MFNIGGQAICFQNKNGHISGPRAFSKVEFTETDFTMSPEVLPHPEGSMFNENLYFSTLLVES